LDFQFGVCDFGSFGFWGMGLWLLDLGILVFGIGILDFGFGVLGFGPWILHLSQVELQGTLLRVSGFPPQNEI